MIQKGELIELTYILFLSMILISLMIVCLILIIMKTKAKNEMVKLDISLNKLKISFKNNYDKQD